MSIAALARQLQEQRRMRRQIYLVEAAGRADRRHREARERRGKVGGSTAMNRTWAWCFPPTFAIPPHLAMAQLVRRIATVGLKSGSQKPPVDAKRRLRFQSAARRSPF